MRRFTTDVLPLLVIVAIVAVLTVVPFINTRQRLKNDERVQREFVAQAKNNLQTQIYLCKFSQIMRKFSATAADARLVTAQQGFSKLKAINYHAAAVYKEVHNELSKLPPDQNCDRLIRKGK